MKFEFSPHVAVQVHDYENALRFYREVLGMESISVRENETEMRIGPMTFWVENSDRGKTFFEFRTDDMAEAEKALLEAGCRIMQEYSPKSKMFADPFGLNFHIFQE